MSVLQVFHRSYASKKTDDKALLAQVQGNHAGVAHVWLIDLSVKHGIQRENGLLLVCGLASMSHSGGQSMGPCMSHCMPSEEAWR